MRLYRICKAAYSGDLSGRGAELFGGRWNSPGNRVVYSSSTAAMALLETLAWTSMSNLLSAGFVLMAIQCPDSSVTSVGIADLDEFWNTPEAYPMTQRIGDTWLKEGNSLVLQVPSAILHMETNILINPAHTLMSKVSIEEVFDLHLDHRLLKHISS